MQGLLFLEELMNVWVIRISSEELMPAPVRVGLQIHFFPLEGDFPL